MRIITRIPYSENPKLSTKGDDCISRQALDIIRPMGRKAKEVDIDRLMDRLNSLGNISMACAEFGLSDTSLRQKLKLHGYDLIKRFELRKIDTTDQL